MSRKGIRLRDVDIEHMARRPAGTTPRLCRRDVEELHALSLWMLRREVLERALEDGTWRDRFRHDVARSVEHPRLPDQPGACNVLFVVQGQRHEDSPLRPAFVLPLIWKPDTADSSQLPPPIANLATKVRQSLRASLAGTYGLHLNDSAGLEPIDLSAVTTWQCESGWAALAAGLLLLKMGGRPKPDVTASGAWRDDLGVVTVDGEEEKATAVRDFGCKCLYLPASETETMSSRGRVPAGLEIRAFPVGEKDPKKALKNLLLALEVPPQIDWGEEIFEQCVRYANSLPREDAQRREEYIRNNITRRHAEAIRREGAPLSGVDGLAILMSRASAALLSILTFRPRHVLVIHTSRDDAEPSHVRKHLAAWGHEDCRLEFERVDVNGHEAVTSAVEDFLSTRGERCAVDVTGLTSGATAAAAIAAVRRGAAVVFFHSDDPTRSGHQAGTERPFVIHPAAPATG